MRYRICDHSNVYVEGEENDIYRKFKYQFENMLNSDELPQNDKEFEEMYVPDGDFEKELNDFLKLHSNSMKFCVGYTGIGKSTSIRHCLELGVSNVARLNTKSRCAPNKYMVIFPTFLDGARRILGDKFDFIGRIASVCTSLEEKHPELREIMRTLEGRGKFYHFIRKHTPRILEPKDDFVFIEKSPEEEIRGRLSYAQKNYPYEYYANKLKYYILCTNSIYDRLVIVLDDIETLSEKEQHDIIEEFLHFYGCMNNTDVQEQDDYRINMLISVRPHTLRMYRHKDLVEKFRGLEAFSVATNTVLKKSAVDLGAFFKGRFDYYTSQDATVIGNKQTWEECYKILMKLNDTFEGRYKNMIINLCFFNVRAALAIYARVLSNRFWIQGNRIKYIFFTVSPEQYNFNNINVIRAIGCGNAAVFTGVEDSVIPNIFLTTEDKDYSIMCLLVMQYFIKSVVDNEGTMEITYGENAIELGEIMQSWTHIVGEEKAKKLYTALKYLFEHKVLRKSIEDTDNMETMDKAESLEDKSRLYISPRGYELMAMLSRDSVYLEMLRECAWREYDGREKWYSYQSSYELLIQKKQDVIFMDLLEYIDYLREQEESFFFDPNSNIDLKEYRNTFGASMMVTHLMSGVEKSLSYSGKLSIPALNDKFLTVRRYISDSTHRLQDEM